MSAWDDPAADPLGDLQKWGKMYSEMNRVRVGRIFIHRAMLVAMVRRWGVAGTRQAANRAARSYGFTQVRIYCYAR